VSKEREIVLRFLPSGEELRLVGQASLNLFINSTTNESNRKNWELKLGPDTKPILLSDYKIVQLPPLPPVGKIPSRKKLRASSGRKHQRIELSLRVLLVNGDRIFRTHTKNISEGGVLLTDHVPSDFSMNECMIILQSPARDENIELPFSFVGQLTERNRIMFSKDDKTSVNISSWIEKISTQKIAA
jgi:hypothetical protein